MEDGEFMAELHQMVARRAASMHLVDTMAFVAEVAERLEEDPVLGEVILAEDSRQGQKGRQLKLHGFTEIDESDGAISMVLGRWVDEGQPSTLLTSDIDQMRGWLENFAHEALEGKLNERIAEASPAYQLATSLRVGRQTITRIRFHLFSNQALSKQFKRESRSEVSGVATETHIWDFYRLKALYGSSREREVVEIDLGEFGSTGIPCIEASNADGLKSFLCVIKGNLLAELFKKYGSRLLEGNVRSFLGMKGGVNKGIRATIQDNAPLFFAYNNGIAATAASAQVVPSGDGTRLTAVSDLQIVNGGQTTASILRAREQDHLSLEGVAVPMKLTVVASEMAHDLIPKIAEYANTQNKVAIADFFANHPFHRKMEEISRRVMVPARAGKQIQSKWFYERSRGQYQNERLYLSKRKKELFDIEYPAGQVINKTELAKYDSVLDEKPHWVSLGAQKNFIKFAGKFSATGKKTESQQWQEMSPNYADAYYQRIAAMAILWKAGEKTISAARATWYEGDYRPQIVAYAWALIFSAIRKAGREPNLMRIWAQQEPDESLMQVFTRAAGLVQAALLKPPEGSTNVGEWAKKEACWNRVSGIPFKLDSKALEWSIGTDVALTEMKRERTLGAKDDAVALQEMVLEKAASGYWKALADWEKAKAVVPGSALMLIRRATDYETAERFSLKELQSLRDLGKECELEGFRHNDQALEKEREIAIAVRDSLDADLDDVLASSDSTDEVADKGGSRGDSSEMFVNAVAKYIQSTFSATPSEPSAGSAIGTTVDPKIAMNPKSAARRVSADQRVGRFLAASRKTIWGKEISFAPSIPEKELAIALRSVPPEVGPEDVMMLLDTTEFDSVTDYMLLTYDTLYIKDKDMYRATKQMSVEAIQSVDYRLLTSQLMLNGSPFADLNGVSKETVSTLVKLMQDTLATP